MRRKTRWMALFMAAAMMMTGCGSSGSTESTDASADTASAAESVSTDTASAGGKVVTMARDLDSGNLDPVMTADNCDIWILNMIVEGLVGTSDDGKEIIPAVGEIPGPFPMMVWNMYSISVTALDSPMARM